LAPVLLTEYLIARSVPHWRRRWRLIDNPQFFSNLKIRLAGTVREIDFDVAGNYIYYANALSYKICLMKRVVIGLLGTNLDYRKPLDRWNHWRPSVSLCQHEELLIHRFELLYPQKYRPLAETIKEDIQSVSPETAVTLHLADIQQPWDFEEVYGVLHDFARAYAFKPDKEEYLVHITTGTHVAQICLFLLTEARYIPGRLIQTGPPKREGGNRPGTYDIIDLDLSRYDRIAVRAKQDFRNDLSYLKSGIETRNESFNKLIVEIENVAMHSREPILLIGPTGAGKSHLARRIYELKKSRSQLTGSFVEVNCATIRGDQALSTLFGHIKGAFTGASQDRQGLIREANKGMIFLDEIGELGLDEQAMLLRAIEEKLFFPMGSDKEVSSDFQLICGTNRDLLKTAQEGKFRQDLLERINLWTFYFPGLRERREDIRPNIQYELDQFARKHGTVVRFNKEAQADFLDFALSDEAKWTANFRDLNNAIVRMATLAPGGRITREVVEEELARLSRKWHKGKDRNSEDRVERLLGSEKCAQLDLFDRLQLEQVLKVCEYARSISDAGRSLFSISRGNRKTVNDADRLKKYLARFGLEWSTIR
jgi:transcriptional regulatory protein RtcR